jgi:tetratricopeptide (TPR) repeat protein
LAEKVFINSSEKERETYCRHQPMSMGFSIGQASQSPFMKLIQIYLAAIATLLIVGRAFGQSSDVSALIRKADELDARNQADAAIDTLTQAEKISPNNPSVLIKLSQEYSDKIDAAPDRTQKLSYANLTLEYAKRAVRQAPDNADAHVCLSVAYGKMTDFVDNKTKMEYSKVVKSEAEKAVELDSKSDLGWLILARWNFEMATLNPILRGIAQALYGQMPPASKETAVECFQKAIAAAPQKIIHHAEYARALEAMGRQQEAKAEWLRVRQLKPADAQDRKYRAQAESKLAGH